ncbi:MAG: DUF2889 domain-containing protein [Desulfatiglandaceae bacterium]|jgi:hypothetical protein
MTQILQFQRNRCTSVSQIDAQTLLSSCHLQDTLTDAYVELTVKLPDLEISDATGEVRRTYQEECKNQHDVLKKVLGVRIGPGMLKIIKGLMGEVTGCDQLAFMVEECCHGVILSFTKDELLKAPEEETRKKDFYANMVKQNIRLYNRCAAFAPGSSLVDGIEPPSEPAERS